MTNVPSKLAPAPTLDMAPEVFDPTAEAFVGSLAGFEAAMNAAADKVELAAASALSAQSAALAAANFVGAWATLRGALAIPAAAAHRGRVWVLVANVADVAAHEPGVSAQWVPSYPQRRLPIFSAATAGLTCWGGNEVAHNAIRTLPLAPETLCSNGSSYVAVAASGSQVAQSLDGITWTLRTLPAVGVWAVVPVGRGYMAVCQGSSGANASAYSSNEGVTWTAFDAGETWNGPNIQNLTAAGAGKAIAHNNSGGVRIATAPGVWGPLQSSPGALIALYITSSGSFVGRITGANYYSSATGLTGSWTRRSLPGTTDTLVQDVDESLLAYKAGSVTAAVYRSTDGVAWTDTGWQLLHATASVRSLNGVYTQGPVASGATGWTRHSGVWVPRTLFFSPDHGPRRLARIGRQHLALTAGLVYLFDPDGAGAALSCWE